MANVKAGNTYYVDTTGTLSDIGNSVVKMIIIQATSGNGTLVITDGDNRNKLSFKIITSGDTQRFNLVGAEVSSNNGMKVVVSNTVSTLILGKLGG